MIKTSMITGGIHLRHCSPPTRTNGTVPASTVGNHHFPGRPPLRTRLTTPLQVLHMNGGLGETSYASNSLMQSKVISMTWPIIEEAIIELYSSLAPIKTIGIADLGCSSGPNTFLAIKEIVITVDNLSKKHGHNLPEFTLHLNDLPGTDFNSIFRVLLQDFQQEIGILIDSCFVNGVPGSFHCRLFAAQTLHFVVSSNTLHWLSKVPDGLETNEDNVCITSTSPKEVIRAYYGQFQTDFFKFLRCRSKELVNGGKMVLTILGRRSNDAMTRESLYIYELIGLALREIASEGLIEEEKLKSFSFPLYTPSAKEVEIEITKEGSFSINRLETSEIRWASCDSLDDDDKGYKATAHCMRSVAEPLLVEHFGPSIIDRLFEKYKSILRDRMSKQDTKENAKIVNITVSMTKRSDII